jgi:hypothetical protein
VNHHANHALLVELSERISCTRKLGATHLQLEWVDADWLLSLAYVAVTNLERSAAGSLCLDSVAGTTGRWDYLDEMEGLEETRLMFEGPGGQELLDVLFARNDDGEEDSDVG